MRKVDALHFMILWTVCSVCSSKAITILVYDYAALPAGQWAKAAADAGIVLAKAGYTATWVACRGAEVQPEAATVCERELGATDYVLRILPGERDRKQGIKRALAHSLVERDGGRYGTLFVDAIQVQAAGLNVSQRLILAYSAAHEVIHLLRGPAHSQSGVMKEYWTHGDAAAIAQLKLPVR